MTPQAPGPHTRRREDGVLAAFLRAPLVTLESVRPGKTAGFQYTTRKLQFQTEQMFNQTEHPVVQSLATPPFGVEALGGTRVECNPSGGSASRDGSEVPREGHPSPPRAHLPPPFLAGTPSDTSAQSTGRGMTPSRSTTGHSSVGLCPGRLWAQATLRPLSTPPRAKGLVPSG